MKKAKREMLSRPICDMGFQHLKEFKMARYERLESPVFVIIEERPKKYFTEEEWQQYFIDELNVAFLIENNLPISEDVENRIIKANRKVKAYLEEERC